MSILEEADMLNEIATHLAKKRGVTVQEVWEEAIEELKLINKAKEFSN